MTRTNPVPETVTLHVPYHVVKRGGRKEIRLPPGEPEQRKTDSTLIKALARAFRWKRMMDSGEFATIGEMAEHERIAPSYMTRVLRLTLLKPDIVEAILEGKHSPQLSLTLLSKGFPIEWEAQRDILGLSLTHQGAATSQRKHNHSKQ